MRIKAELQLFIQDHYISFLFQLLLLLMGEQLTMQLKVNEVIIVIKALL